MSMFTSLRRTMRTAAAWTAVVAALSATLVARAQSLAPTGYWQYTGTGDVVGTLTSSGTNTSGVMSVGGTGLPTYTAGGMVGSGVLFAYDSQPTTQAASKFLALNTSFGTNAAPVGGYALGTTFSISTWYFVSSLPGTLRSYIYEGLTNDDVSAGNPTGGSTTLRTYNINVNQDFTGAMATGTWRHLAQTVTLAGGTSTMVTYFDGIASGTLSTAVTGGSTGINLATARSGTNPPTTSQNRPLNGTLDETAVWQTRALSAAEVLAVYNRGLAGVSLTNTATVAGYAAGSTNNAWLTGANWASGTAPGQTGSPASTNGNVAVVGNHAFGGGLGIDMAAATGNLALGAITFNSLAGSGGLSIGNSAAANGTLTLNGAQIDGFENVVLNNEGLSNLTITNVQGADAGQRMTLQLGGTTNMVRAAAGRTLTITTDITERAAGSSLTVDGGGTVVLGGTCTYSGGTVVSAGRLAGTTASLQGLITNNATVEFVQTVGGTYSGAMSGTGALIKTGSGLLTFAGNNTFSGLTTISAGRVVGSTASLPSAIANSAELEFAQASAGTFAAVISGTGSLAKTGTGNLILSGSSSYTGATSVAAGRLSVNGSLGDSPVAVLAGAELGGSGSIAGPVSIAGGGFLAPGNSIASLTTGTATFAAGATFAYEVDSTNPLSLGSAADVLVVNGNLNLDPGNGTLLTLTDLASSIQPFVEDTTIFALINYSGSWNGGLFTYGSNVLSDGERFTAGSQMWEIDYNASTGGDNFTADYLPSSSFVTVTAIPEPTTYAMALAGLACSGFSMRRRRKRIRHGGAMLLVVAAACVAMGGSAVQAATVTWFGPSQAANSNATWTAGSTSAQNYGVAFVSGTASGYSMDWLQIGLNTASVATGSGSLVVDLMNTTNLTPYSAVPGTTVHASDTINFTCPPTTATAFTVNLAPADFPNIANFSMTGTTGYALRLWGPSGAFGIMRTTGYANGTTNNFYTVSDGFVALDTFRNNGANYTNNTNSYPTLSIAFGTTAVPEPATCAMALAGLACGGYSMWRRRKRG